MPRLSSQLPRYRKHASGQAFVYLDGRNIYLGPYRSLRSRQEYDRVIGEWIANGRHLPPREGTELTVTELVAAYLRHAKEYYPKVQHRTIVVARLLKSTYGHRPAREYGPLALQATRQKLINKGASRVYVNNLVAEIKLIFKFGAAQELIGPEVHSALTKVAGLRQGRTTAIEHPPVAPVPDVDVEGTMPHLPAIVADMVKLQRLTGARPDEICAMRPVDIDQTQSVWIYRPPHHKTLHRGKLREIAVGPRAQEILRPYLLRVPAMFCFSPTEAVEQWMREKRQNRQSKVQPSQRDRNTGSTKRRPGNRYTTPSYRRAIHRGCQKAGIPQWSPNQLRHTAATQARREYGLEAAQALLGHSNADTTQIYAERNLKLATEVAAKIG